MAEHPVVDRFRTWLREHNLPVTAQRMAVADIVLASDHELSADDVAHALTARGASVGTATIYRALDALVESGLAAERDFGEGFRRFEPMREVPHYEQLLCTVCGRVEEFRDERLEVISRAVAEARGFECERHRLVIYGVCHGCRRAPRAAGAGNAP